MYSYSTPAQQAEMFCACGGKATFVASDPAELQMLVDGFYKAHEGHEDTSPRPPGWDKPKEQSKPPTCDLPPAGWRCFQPKGHLGPCPTVPTSRTASTCTCGDHRDEHIFPDGTGNRCAKCVCENFTNQKPPS